MGREYQDLVRLLYILISILESEVEFHLGLEAACTLNLQLILGSFQFQAIQACNPLFQGLLDCP